MATSNADLGSTLLRLSHHYHDEAELFAAVRKAHPTASKKDIVLAALSVMIDHCESDAFASKKLHRLAIAERDGDN